MCRFCLGLFGTGGRKGNSGLGVGWTLDVGRGVAEFPDRSLAGYAVPGTETRETLEPRRAVEGQLSGMEDMIRMVRERGYRLTLGEILNTHHAAEYRKHFSLMRRQGWTVHVDRDNAHPSNNLYTFKEPPAAEPPQVRATFLHGQGLMLDIFT